MFDDLNTIITEIDSGESSASVTDLGTKIANVIVMIAVGVSFVSVAYGFIQMMMSAGDPKAADKAKKTITWGVAGILIASLAWVLKRIFVSMLG